MRGDMYGLTQSFFQGNSNDGESRMSSLYEPMSLVAAYLPRQEPLDLDVTSPQPKRNSQTDDGRVKTMPLGFVIHPSQPTGDVHGGTAAGRVYLAERHHKKVYVDAMLARRIAAENGTLDIPGFQVTTDRRARRKWTEHLKQGRPFFCVETCFDRERMKAPRKDDKRGKMTFGKVELDQRGRRTWVVPEALF